MPKGVQGCVRAFTGRANWLLALCISVLCVLPQELPAAVRTAPGPAKIAELPADAPVRRFQTLLTRKGATKESLRKLEAELEQARNARADAPNVAKASFFLARVQQEIAKKSGLKADWFKAAENFGSTAERFPKYQLAPDALLHRGLIRMEHLSDPDGAQSDFQTLRRLYPRSPLTARAASLQRIAAKIPPGTSKKVELSAEAPAADLTQPRYAGTSDRPLLLEVRPKNTGASARIVLDLESRVKYRYQLL